MLLEITACVEKGDACVSGSCLFFAFLYNEEQVFRKKSQID